MKSFVFLALGFLVSQPAMAVERLWMQHGEIAELFDKFMSIPAERRERLEFRVKVLPMQKAPLTGITLSMRTKNGPVPLAMGPDGVFAFPDGPKLREENPPLWIDSPPQAKVALGIDVLITLPNGPGLRYADAMELLDRAGSGMRKHAGIWALFMPKPEGLELRFGPGGAATVTAQGADGEKRYTSDANGVLILPADDRLRASNPTLQMSRPVVEARPYFKTLMQLVPDSESSQK